MRCKIRTWRVKCLSNRRRGTTQTSTMHWAFCVCCLSLPNCNSRHTYDKPYNERMSSPSVWCNL
nr:unnamed protein product [Callosobruchus chinensis]